MKLINFAEPRVCGFTHAKEKLIRNSSDTVDVGEGDGVDGGVDPPDDAAEASEEVEEGEGEAGGVHQHLQPATPPH